jgi:hypothetical protein
MAILTQSNSGDGPITGWPIATPAPAGQHLAVCLAVKDTLNYEAPTYEDPTITEIKDVTRFLFGLADGSMVQTSEMKISGHEKSKLVGTLVSWLGSPPPIGFDTETLVGQGVTLNIVAKVSKKGTNYSDVTSVSPVMAQLANQVPPVANFTIPEGDGPSASPQMAPVQPIQPAPAQVATTVTVDQPQAVQPIQPVVQQPVQPVQQPVQQVQPAQGQQTLGGQFTPPPTQTVPF